MEAPYPIHDLYIEPLNRTVSTSWRSLTAYAFADHLMKRIGLIELVELSAGDALPSLSRQKADELWTLIAGEVSFEWIDLRENSPTFNASHQVKSDSPLRVLVPFGVQFKVTADRDSSLLRISSHAADLEDIETRSGAEGAEG